jgi:hypothetical protein
MTSPLKIIDAKEPWVEYQLEDGTLLRFRFTACSFRRTGKMTALGDPEYSFTHQIMSETHANPEESGIVMPFDEYMKKRDDERVR